ncbi:MAG TPA: ATP-binding protein [Longimicrobium sp.]|nr:ATP-binding protein [Longimicrobium sp.]
MTLSDLLDLSELFGDFRDEGRAQMAHLDDAVQSLEAGAAPTEAARAELLRALHTLKGNSAMLGLRPMQELVHTVEDAFKQGRLQASQPIRLLQRAASALRGALESAGSPDQDAAFEPLPALRSELADALAAPAPSAPAAIGPQPDAQQETRVDVQAAEAVAAVDAIDRLDATDERVPFADAADATDSADEARGTSADDAPAPPSAGAVGSIESAGAAGAAGSIASAESAGPAEAAVETAMLAAGDPVPAPATQLAPPDTSAPPAAATQPAAPARGDAGVREETLRIPFGRLDPLLSQVDDLARAVEALRVWAVQQAGALQAAGLRRALGDHVETLNGIASVVRRSATALRLVPVERVFSRFPPLAADLARERGKRVRVELHGEGTELDKATADALLDPLLHLVRNAVDHGVETPAERRAAGKPETATVRLSAAQEGDRVRIEVEDDGRGLDRAGIERRARELGLLASIEEPTDEEVDELLFRPGFSTRALVDEVSGRGVGLDVVRAAVSRLRGQVRVEDGDEGGTRFVLHLPLTVAMVPVLFFQAAGETLAIPALDVESTVRAGTPGRVGPAETVDVGDEAVPLIRLERVFGWESAPDPRFVLVLRRGARAAALGADRLLAQDAATVRALPAALGSPRGVSGAVVDAGGRVVLLLDPGEMLEMNVDLYRGGTGGG